MVSPSGSPFSQGGPPTTSVSEFVVQDPLETVKLFTSVELVVFVANGDQSVELMDETGRLALRLFKSLGVTSHVVAIQSPDTNNLKEASAVKKRVLTDVSSHVRRHLSLTSTVLFRIRWEKASRYSLSTPKTNADPCCCIYNRMP